MKIPELFQKHYLDKGYTSLGLFRAIRIKFDVEKVFYPGSYVHISPSLIFPNVTYADSYRNTYKFFEDQQTIEFIYSSKEYSEEPVIRFYQQDYNTHFKELGQEFDLVISQYAGFVGQAAKPYLKKGGLLVCNNSHGDASMASLDSDYTLMAVYNRKTDDKFTISDKNLEAYLIPKDGVIPKKEELIKTMRGKGYTKSPSGYIFMKTEDQINESEARPEIEL